MDSAAYQELMNPSRFNIIAGITLVVLIVLCLLLVGLTAIKGAKTEASLPTQGKKRGKGFKG